MVRVEGDGWQEALDEYERIRDDLYQGKTPPPKAEGLSLADLCNVRVGGQIQQTRSVFKYAHDDGLIDQPIRFGSHFKRPSKRVFRLERKKNGLRMLENNEVRKLIEVADIPMQAMIYLGINCGLGASEISRMAFSNLDLESGWLDYPRPKTGIDRRVPLWKETVDALRKVIDNRPTPKSETNHNLVGQRHFGAVFCLNSLL